MASLSRTLFTLLALGLLAAGCTAAPHDPVAPTPNQPTQGAPAAGQPDAALPETAGLFPAGDWEAEYIFDDETKQTHEWWLRDGQRMIAGNANGVYAVWHLAPDGIYRRDPLGGAKAPFLRYLPAKLEEGLAWSQQSGDATVRFSLQTTDRCGDQPDSYIDNKAPCWLLQVVNRGRLQRFFFAMGKRLEAASQIDPARPANSYHKDAVGSHKLPMPASRADWLAKADSLGAFNPGEVPPVTAIKPAEFQQALAGVLKPAMQVKSGPALLPLVDGQPPLVLYDETASRWERVKAPIAGPCTYQVQSGGPTPYLYELCGTPVESGERYPSAMTFRAWRRDRQGQVNVVPWDAGPAADYWASGLGIEVKATGEVIVREAMMDVRQHTKTTVYVMTSDYGEIKSEQYDLPAGGAYPATPQDVLTAAFYARWQDLRAEVPQYFASPAAADRFLALVPGGVSKLTPDKTELGQVTRVTPKGAYDPAVQVAPGSVTPGQPIGFAHHLGGCCDQFAIIWGTVRFEKDGTGRWVIAELTPEYVQEAGKVTPIH